MKLFKKPDLSNMGILKFLPSKKFIIILSTGLGLLVLYLVVNSSSSLSQKISSFLNRDVGHSSLVVQKINASDDTDKDGLDGWQEFLWRTDPKNPDTDGDGTKDGEEAKSNRDPLVPGPNDFLSDKLTEEEQKALALPSTNITNDLSKNLILRYASEKRALNGGALEDQNKKNIADSVISNINLDTGKPIVYSLSDLKIRENDSQNYIILYVHNSGAIIKFYSTFISPQRDELILKNAAVDKDEAALAELTKNMGFYQNLINDLLRTPVPPSLKNYHLQLINTYSSIKNNVRTMTFYFDDPLGALVAVEKQERNIKTLKEIFIALNKVLGIDIN